MHTGDFAYLAIQLTSNGQIYSRTMFKCDELKNIFSIKYSLELYFLYQSNKKLSQLLIYQSHYCQNHPWQFYKKFLTKNLIAAFYVTCIFR